MKNIRWVFECKDYVRFRLTGEARAEITGLPVADSWTCIRRVSRRSSPPSSASRACGTRCRRSVPLLDIAGHITPEAAALTGLLPGTPVIGGMFDIDACASP